MMKFLLSPLLFLTAAFHATGAVYGSWAQDAAPAASPAVIRLMQIPESELLRLLPNRSGIFFVMCPTPNCGNGQGSAFSWNPDEPEVLTCDFCRQKFPSQQYPENGITKVQPPSGKILQEPYHQAQDGRRYYFSAGIASRKATVFATAALWMARHYYRTGDESYARRAALILCGLARNFPDFAFKYDFPAHPVTWYTGVPADKELMPDHRTSRWSWWAYTDIPVDLILTFDLIRHSRSYPQVLTEQKLSEEKDILQGFFFAACDAPLRYPERYHNMSPRLWRDLVIAGRICGKDDYVETAIQRAQQFAKAGFYFDGFWKEATVSYHAQAVLYLSRVADALEGYRGKAAREFLPALPAASQRLQQFRYPDGRRLPLSDTWVTPKRAGSGYAQSSFLSPGLRYAALCGRLVPEQTQLHLSFPAKIGHRHYDLLGMTLFSHHREMLSDIGYTHTRMACWTIQSAAHNLVVVDGCNQQETPDVFGNLLYMDIASPAIQVISVDGRRAYPELGQYRRTLFLIRRMNGTYCCVDFFEAGPGGKIYDYFLHGSADVDETITIGSDHGPGQAQTDDLMPPEERASWRMPENEQDRANLNRPYWGYGFLQNQKRIALPRNATFGYASFKPDQQDACTVFFPLASDLEIWQGDNPSVRRARENNALSDKFRRNHLVLRRRISTAPACFTTVLLPSGQAQDVQLLRTPQAGILQLRFPEGEYWIFHHQQQDAQMGNAVASGEYGCLFFTPDDQLQSLYLVNGRLQTATRQIRHTPFPRTTITTASGEEMKYHPPFSGYDATGAPADFVCVKHADGRRLGYLLSQPLRSCPQGTLMGNWGFQVDPKRKILMFQQLPGWEWPLEKVSLEFFRRAVVGWPASSPVEPQKE